MIGSISGKIVFKSPTSSVVECAGVGYEIFHSPFAAEKMPAAQADVFLLIHTNVREDAIQLFGFISSDERAIFRELLRVNGIGPKMALSILSSIAHDELCEAVSRKDITRLQKIPGIGKKTAERLLVELSDRLKNFAFAGAASTPMEPALPKESELESVLVNLGYQRSEVLRAVKAIRARESNFNELSLEALVKSTLRELTQGRPV